MDVCTMMVEERKKLDLILENTAFTTREQAIEYAAAMTKMIWDHQMVGMVHEYYGENIVYKTANGVKLTTQDAVVKEFLALQAAFPDMRVFITESFASGNETEGFNVYQRSYCEGTNLGASIYGPATGRKLDENNSFGQTIYIFKKVDGKWKVVTEYSIRSQYTIEKLLKNEL